MLLQRKRLKMLAIISGALATIAWVPFAIFVTFGTWGAMFQVQGTVGTIFIFWAPLGLLGAASFWFWAFSKQITSTINRAAISVLISIGIFAMIPFIFLGKVSFAMAAAGIIPGTYAIVDIWLPSKPIQPTTKSGAADG